MSMEADPLSGPDGSGPLLAAVQWLQETLLGTLATTVAIIAIAWIGFGMLNGRVSLQRSVTVILGCFIVFGASGIVAGLLTAAEMAGTAPPPAEVAVPVSPPPTMPPQRQEPYDPYAGASVPQR